MGDKIRVCYALNSFEIGGAETVALDLARSHDPDLFEVEVVAMIEPSVPAEHGMRDRFEQAGVNTSVIRQPNYRSPLALWKIFRYLKKGKFDIIHGHNRGSDFWGAKVGRWAGISHCFWTRHLVYRDFSPKQIRRYSSISKKADLVIAVSETVRQACIDTEKIDPNKVETVVNGIDTEKFAPLPEQERNAKRAELSLANNELFLLFVGRFSEQKAPETFVRLIWKLRAAGQKVRGFMCGYGPLGANLKTLVDEGEDGVEILGLRSDIPALLASCDLFVSTSRNEGLPLNVMEAMSAGAPFVGPEIPQIGELVAGTPALASRLFAAPPLTGPVDEKLIAGWALKVTEILQHDSTDDSAGGLGRGIILEKFSLIQMVKRYEALFLKACGK